MNIFFSKKNIQKHSKSGFLYVLYDSEMIWEKNVFSIFRTKFLDFGSLWRPHRTVNQYILLVVLSLPIVQQLRQRILSMHYWFGCSDGPKLRYLAKNLTYAVTSHARKTCKFRNFSKSQMNIFFQKIFKNILKVVFYTF